jgi:hypothetical protein
MYSPKISEGLIPDLYTLAKARKKPMTYVVNEILSDYLRNIEIMEEETQEITFSPKKVPKLLKRSITKSTNQFYERCE